MTHSRYSEEADLEKAMQASVQDYIVSEVDRTLAKIGNRYLIFNNNVIIKSQFQFMY